MRLRFLGFVFEPANCKQKEKTEYTFLTALVLKYTISTRKIDQMIETEVHRQQAVLKTVAGIKNLYKKYNSAFEGMNYKQLQDYHRRKSRMKKRIDKMIKMETLNKIAALKTAQAEDLLAQANELQAQAQSLLDYAQQARNEVQALAVQQTFS